NEHHAMQGAINKANKFCKARHLNNAVVIHHRTTYEGVDKAYAMYSDNVSHYNNTQDKKSAPSSRRDNDYKTTLIFTCD
ncbi:MAG: hypothetical protein M3R00_09225, partial [Pseudomonadota bacterium]|nr:hypothetical protein [Pseudomonadota bacterium]